MLLDCFTCWKIDEKIIVLSRSLSTQGNFFWSSQISTRRFYYVMSVDPVQWLSVELDFEWEIREKKQKYTQIQNSSPVLMVGTKRQLSTYKIKQEK